MKTKKQQANLEYLNDKQYILGIDPCDSRMDCVLTDKEKRVIGRPFSFSVNSNGFKVYFFKKLMKNLNLVAKAGELTTARGMLDSSKIVIAVEHSINFWQNFAYFCHKRGFSVVLVNPLSTYHSRPLHDADFSKQDTTDAFLVAENTCNGNFIKFLPSEDSYAQARNLSIHRSKIKKDLQAAKKRLSSKLKMRFPEFSSVLDPDTKTARYLLTHYFDAASFATMDTSTVSEAVKHISRGQVDVGALERLKVAAAASIGIPCGTTPLACDEQWLIGKMVARIELVQAELRELDERMISCLKDVPCFEVLTSIKGISEVSAAIFLAECGDLKKYSSYKQIEKLAGLNLVLADSGKYSGPRKISKIGNKRLRTIIYLIGTQLKRLEPGIRKKFLKRSIRKRPYKENIIALSSNVLRLMMALVTQNRKYVERKQQVEEVKLLDFEYLKLQKKAA